MRTAFPSLLRAFGTAVATVALALVASPLSAQEIYQHVTLYETGFEDGTLQGWHGRGTGNKLETLEVVANPTKPGNKAVKISGRTTTWQGPIHLVSDNVKPGDTFRLGAWVYYDEGPATATFILSVERGFKDPKADHKYNNVTGVSVKKGEWGFVTADYTIGTDPTQKTLECYIERPYKEDSAITAEDRISFYVDDLSALLLDPAMKPKMQEDIPNLIDAWRDTFTLGTAVVPDDVDPSAIHAQLLMKHFGALVAGNAMKWDGLEPKENQFQYTEADKIVEFAELTGMSVRGHTLVWHAQTPSWVFQDPADPKKPASKELLLKRMTNHIESVMGHYQGRVASWDVVNEAVSDKAGLRTGAEGSKWHEILGPEFIDQAFRIAKKADPEAQLVYNDYNLESDAQKRAETVKLIKGMKARGVPVDAVGLQMHVSIGYPALSQIKETIAEFAALGVKVVITELDVSIYAGEKEAKKPATPELLLAQAQRYKDLFEVFRQAAGKGWLDTVMVWGLSDDGSWLNDFPVFGRTDAPLFFDNKLQAKPAFWAVVDPTQVKGLK